MWAHEPLWGPLGGTWGVRRTELQDMERCYPGPVHLAPCPPHRRPQAVNKEEQEPTAEGLMGAENKDNAH